MSQQHNDDKVVMGRFGRPVGVKGQVKLFGFSNDFSQLINYQPWYMRDAANQWKLIECTNITKRDKFLVVTIKGVESKEAAQLLTHKEVSVKTSVLPKLPEGEYYWRDLIGLNVINSEGHAFGSVTELMETGSNDVLVIELEDKKRLVPFLMDDVILNIDLKKKLITVDWDEDF